MKKSVLFAVLLCAVLSNNVQASQAVSTYQNPESEAKPVMALLKSLAAAIGVDRDPNEKYQKNVIDIYHIVKQQYPNLSPAAIHVLSCQTRNSSVYRDAVRDAVQILLLGYGPVSSNTCLNLGK